VANYSRAGRRSQAQAARTRERILDRAERLFARKGYRGVSLRSVAAASGVRPFTVQHHFGSKLRLYQQVLCRWDEALMKRVGERLGDAREPAAMLEQVLGELFDFFLSRRDWVALNARAVLGEGLPRGVSLADRRWLRFLEDTLPPREGAGGLDLRLLLITFEGILNHHVVAAAHYRHLFGCDVTEPRLRARTQRHLKQVFLALLSEPVASGAVRPPPERRRRVR
jgi:AcrR family transcriptional regulator